MGQYFSPSFCDHGLEYSRTMVDMLVYVLLCILDHVPSLPVAVVYTNGDIAVRIRGCWHHLTLLVFCAPVKTVLSSNVMLLST